MVVKRRVLPYDVLEAAHGRISRAFDNGVRVYLSLSGGKDSIVLADLVYRALREGRADPALLTVVFVDEEAIFDGVERIVRDWRRKFIAAGAEFRWYCIEVKHFNCFNRLTNDESFICWDSTKRDVWVRKMPSFAITDHPDLRRREESYQSFLPRIMRDGIRVAGVRSYESIQRLNAFQQNYTRPEDVLFQPIFDWRDTDIWRYIEERDLDFPETYMHLYQTGSSRRQMRISQFFSIDTARSLVKMDEYEPGLMERIIRREPNAYLAALYWDTELFRSAGGSGAGGGRDDDGAPRDYRALTFAALGNPEYRQDPGRAKDLRKIRTAIFRNSTAMEQSHWKLAYEIIEAGDPKDRSYRALLAAIAKQSKGYK